MSELLTSQNVRLLAPTEGGEGYRPGGFYDADTLVDRPEVEAKAQWLIENRHTRPEALPITDEKTNNARTALMEALTASGHLSRVEISGTLEEINAQVLERLLNGYDDALPKHERDRRFAEICEELVIQKIHKMMVDGLLPSDTEVLTISDYADFLGNTAIGYRATNKKGMTRSTGLRSNEDGTYTRIIEQVSRSNGTSVTTDRFYQDEGITRRYDGPDDICNLSKQAVYSRSTIEDGVVDVQRRLDNYAGVNIRFGDVIDEASTHAPYEGLRQESARREEQIEFYIDNLAKYDEKLEDKLKAGLISQEEYSGMYNKQIIETLRAICLLEPSYAKDTFGAKAVPYYEQASTAFALGDMGRVQEILRRASSVEQPVVFCGVTISAELAKELGLETDSSGDLAVEGKKKWKWKKGVCRVENCATRPGETEVGPCAVCKNCQHWFDKKLDPAKLYKGTKNIIAISSKQAKIKKKSESHPGNILKAAA